ncbi:Ubiquinone/menaquinone biosynthesis C-methyltransferase UbiE [Candidatus Magnetomoraceae bacterium gMMP-15]
MNKQSNCLEYQTNESDQKIKWVNRHFNTVSKQYDAMNTILSFGIHYLWKRTSIKMMNLKPGDRVLDLCGGTGDLSILASKASGLSGMVVLYDINREMIDTGRAKTTNGKLRKQIIYVQGNAEKISFSDNCFDAVTVGFGMRNLSNMERGFKEIYRALKPGGKIMCLEFSEPVNPVFRWLYDFYSFNIMPLLGELLVGSRNAYTYLPESIRMFPLPDKLSNILKNIGFSNVSYQRLTNGIAVVHLGEKSI